MIHEANTDEERQEVLDFFLETFDIAPNAVPMTNVDDLYAPIVLQYRDGAGQLQGGALTCRAQVAVGSVVAKKYGAPFPHQDDYINVLDRHSELDLIKVAPDARGQGIGSQMLAYLEKQLRSRGVRVWFGNVTQDLDIERLRGFYTSHQFTVLDPGQPLPPFFGRRWVPPNTMPPAFFFYKKLTNGTS
ncbi:GNAT family N-acetyltransferase [Nocardia sp. NPDC051911]|uniref:GNAT family N-acetyltransferase n=1 Tax=Nocardia sp. NPDC051911 TaxID=3154648 RepID=UPI00343A1E83